MSLATEYIDSLTKKQLLEASPLALIVGYGSYLNDQIVNPIRQEYEQLLLIYELASKSCNTKLHPLEQGETKGQRYRKLTDAVLRMNKMEAENELPSELPGVQNSNGGSGEPDPT